jgi:hypothetical protein
MEVLFVHGMGRSPVSGWPLLCQLRRAGLKTRSFSYLVSIEAFAAIQTRLEERITEIAAKWELHSGWPFTGRSSNPRRFKFIVA